METNTIKLDQSGCKQREQSDLGAYCLQYWQPKYIEADDRAEGSLHEWLKKLNMSKTEII